jgi:hypothetical protein
MKKHITSLSMHGKRSTLTKTKTLHKNRLNRQYKRECRRSRWHNFNKICSKF